MKYRRLITEQWNKGWTYERIILAMERGGFTACSFGFKVTVMRKGSHDVTVTWANCLTKVWPMNMWQAFLNEHGLKSDTRKEDGLAVITEADSSA